MTETIYRSDRYYSPGYGGLHRTRPRYYGHSLFDIHVWGGGHRGYYPGYRRGAYGGYPGWHRPVRPYRPVRPRPVRPPRVDRRPDRRPDRRRDRRSTDPVPSQELTRTVPNQDLPRSRVDNFINGQPADTYGKYDNLDTERRPERRPRRTRDRSDDNSGNSVPDTRVPSRRDLERSDRRERLTRTPERRTQPRSPETRRPKTRRPETRRPETRRPAPRRTQPPRPPAPRPSPPPAAKAAPRSRDVSPPRPSRDTSNNTPVRYDMFPDDRPYDGVVISSDRDCAREDRVTLFIPYERLEAARFDGLVIVLRDVSYDSRIDQTTIYDERPLYIPPNYIEGFKQGASLP